MATRRDIDKKLAPLGKPVVWFRSPYAATALAPTVLRSMGISPTRVYPRRDQEVLRLPLVDSVRLVLADQLVRWPRTQVDVSEELAAELRRYLDPATAMERLPHIRHQLNSHPDSSVGVLNTLFLRPTLVLEDDRIAYLFDGAIVVIDEPDFFRCDNDGRLHGETGAAIRWSDGWSIYVWHGTVVPEAWIRERDKIDVEVALTWPNIEERRAAAEIMGWKKILVRLKAKVIDQHKDPAIGTLWHAELPMGQSPVGRGSAPGSFASEVSRWVRTEPCRFIEVKCGTGRMFVIPVPPTIQTAMGAQEWMWGLGPGEYKPETRT